MKAGAFTPAIPCGGGGGRGPPMRSMKAGAFTPAIRVVTANGDTGDVVAQ